MKSLMGVLCCVSFTCVALAALASPKIDYTLVERKDSQGVTNNSDDPKPDGSETKTVLIQKAYSLEVATMARCTPCKKMKEITVPALRKAGYRVTVVARAKDKRGTKLFPTLYYLDAKGKVVLEQVGYKTFKEVTRNLGK